MGVVSERFKRRRKVVVMTAYTSNGSNSPETANYVPRQYKRKLNY